MLTKRGDCEFQNFLAKGVSDKKKTNEKMKQDNWEILYSNISLPST